MTPGARTYLDRRAKRKKTLPPRAVFAIIFFASIAIVAAAISVIRNNADTIADPIDAQALQNVIVPDNLPEIIVNYEGFKVSFNPEQHVPNYVVWELTGEETRGDIPRKAKFHADKNVPGCASLDDYRNSGFDRGHMAPAADMKWNVNAMDDSHALTNMCPQTHTLNGGRWATLEDKARLWAQRDSAIIIIAGPILTDEIAERIGPSKVAVPERFFKVIMAPFANPPRAIAFIMPNFPPYDPLEVMATTVDNIEQITGFDFFSVLPDSIENIVENQCHFNYWNRRKK